jgi:hypothetical protein
MRGNYEDVDESVWKVLTTVAEVFRELGAAFVDDRPRLSTALRLPARYPGRESSTRAPLFMLEVTGGLDRTAASSHGVSAGTIENLYPT